MFCGITFVISVKYPFISLPEEEDLPSLQDVVESQGVNDAFLGPEWR